MRIYTKRADEVKVGQYIKDESTGAYFSVTFIGLHYIDLLPIVYVEPEPVTNTPQKYYQKFNKGWNR